MIPCVSGILYGGKYKCYRRVKRGCYHCLENLGGFLEKFSLLMKNTLLGREGAEAGSGKCVPGRGNQLSIEKKPIICPPTCSPHS